jgi:hypothetical protein
MPVVRAHPIAHRPHGQARAGRHTDLAEDSSQVVIDGVVTQAEANADLTVRQPVGDEA